VFARHGESLRLAHLRIEVIPAAPCAHRTSLAHRRPVILHQRRRFLLLLQQRIRSGEIRRGEVAAPCLLMLLPQMIAQIEHKGGGVLAMPREQVNRRRLDRRLIEAVHRATRHLLHAFARAFEQRGRHGIASITCFGQKPRHIDRQIIHSRVRGRIPIAEATVRVLTTAQQGEGRVELLRRFSRVEAEVRLLRQQQSRNGAAGDLLGAAIRILVQVGLQTSSRGRAAARTRWP
jgi:hypothetical protein